MIIYLIRHGAVRGNLEKRYVGISDEHLCGTGAAGVKALRDACGDRLDRCGCIFVSPMKRCMETADILFPGRRLSLVEDFRECDFGDFEGKNHIELSDNDTYRQWLALGRITAFPNGEDVNAFKRRCIGAFLSEAAPVCASYADKNREAALVVHGGTIMSLLEYFEGRHEYYMWQCGNAEGFAVDYADGAMKVTEQISAGTDKRRNR